MLTQDEMDKVVLEAKKSLSAGQIKDALRKCSYGGIGIGMSLKEGGEKFGKTNRSAVSEN